MKILNVLKKGYNSLVSSKLIDIGIYLCLGTFCLFGMVQTLEGISGFRYWLRLVSLTIFCGFFVKMCCADFKSKTTKIDKTLTSLSKRIRTIIADFMNSEAMTIGAYIFICLGFMNFYLASNQGLTSLIIFAFVGARVAGIIKEHNTFMQKKGEIEK